jgi:hypothetical protein
LSTERARQFASSGVPFSAATPRRRKLVLSEPGERPGEAAAPAAPAMGRGRAPGLAFGGGGAWRGGGLLMLACVLSLVAGASFCSEWRDDTSRRTAYGGEGG